MVKSYRIVILSVPIFLNDSYSSCEMVMHVDFLLCPICVQSCTPFCSPRLLLCDVPTSPCFSTLLILMDCDRVALRAIDLRVYVLIAFVEDLLMEMIVTDCFFFNLIGEEHSINFSFPFLLVILGGFWKSSSASVTLL